MKRTTVALEDNLLRELKARAAREGVPFGRLVNDLLHQAQARAPRSLRRVNWPTFSGRGVRPGVEIGNRRSLYDLLDPPEKWQPKP